MKQNKEDINQKLKSRGMAGFIVGLLFGVLVGGAIGFGAAIGGLSEVVSQVHIEKINIDFNETEMTNAMIANKPFLENLVQQRLNERLGVK